MNKQEIARKAFDRAANGESMSNFDRIIAGFIAMGIPEAEILPRENVFTYHAWRHQGRQVQKGSHGVKVSTFAKDEKTGRSFPKRVTVFHITQTAERSQKYVRAEVIKTDDPTTRGTCEQCGADAEYDSVYMVCDNCREPSPKPVTPQINAVGSDSMAPAGALSRMAQRLEK